ncbi:hydroxyacylglutathione hydrolase [Cyanobium sp. Morenito 9A2]|uniref:hydroxyacylglutathione hydrolase n=1 Tax=Cyanobium sp. Morenito 9A2 TaxID=2823718 RepID=UPI0020CC40D3|nr:hydroxyacylglutathione hydrolase [Cyanobium sp. Morenito 9A2]MCP9849255.1 hydroxyacylglutathione hydrolase [Cyanobium sp. Morenito 9A2]
MAATPPPRETLPTAAATAAATVELIPVLEDNYVFVWHGGPGTQAVVVDPAVAEPVISWLEQRQLELVAVLQTHHHDDHIGGTPGLLARWPGAEVYASGADIARIPLQTRSVKGGEHFALLGRPVRVLDVPGHTRAHIAYHLPPVPGTATRGELFCGDTLFVGGCGRLFEGSPAQMQQSLQSLAALPADTRIWCAHEYTEGNYAWAAAERPHDPAVGERLRQVRELRAAGRCTVPSSIGAELVTNLFLRAADAAELGALRESKNNWRG